MRNQQTLAAPITCSGVGLHSGQPVTITLRPAPSNTGVVFVNRNGHAGATLPASVDHRVPTELCTAISGNGFQVKTIEHVLAALSGLEVDNVFIDVTAVKCRSWMEVPHHLSASSDRSVWCLRSDAAILEDHGPLEVSMDLDASGSSPLPLPGSPIQFITTIRSSKRRHTSMIARECL